MRAITRELRKRGIIYTADEFECMRGAEYDVDEKLISIEGNFLMTVVYSAVLDPILRLYDRRTLEFVGEQNMFPEMSFSGVKTWGSYIAE